MLLAHSQPGIENEVIQTGISYRCLKSLIVLLGFVQCSRDIFTRPSLTELMAYLLVLEAFPCHEAG